MVKPANPAPPIYAIPALVSFDTALLLIAWLAFAEILGLVVLSSTHYLVAYLFCQSGAVILRLSQAALLSPEQRELDPRWSLNWQERRVYRIILPAALLSAVIMVFIDLTSLNTHLLLPGLLLWIIYFISWKVRRQQPDAEVFFLPKPLVISLFFCYTGGFFLWSTLSFSRLEISSALILLSLYLGMASGLEKFPGKGSKHPPRVSIFFLENLCPGWTKRIGVGLAILSGLTLLVATAIPAGPLGILFAALSAVGFNLFVLSLLRESISPLMIRILSRPLMILPTLPMLFYSGWSWWQGG